MNTFFDIIGKAVGIIFITSLILLLYGIINDKYKQKKRTTKILKEKLEEKRILNNKIMELQASFNFEPIYVKNIGGSGYPLQQDQALNFGLTNDSLILVKKDDPPESIEISFENINELEISGPGKVVTNAGIAGGGFGLEGFLQGAVAAAVINAATTKSSTNTFIRLLSNTGEIYLHTTEIEPTALKMKLSPVFVNLANRSKKATGNSGGSIAEEIERLQKLLKDGVISQEEFDIAKKKIIS